MTTFESDHGDPGGPWNLSKKLRFWVFWPLEGSQTMVLVYSGIVIVFFYVPVDV